MLKVESHPAEKFERFKSKTLYPLLSEGDQALIEALNVSYRFTFQELRQLAEIARDFEMWHEEEFRHSWNSLEANTPSDLQGLRRKEFLMRTLIQQVHLLKQKPAVYGERSPDFPKRSPLKVVSEVSDKKVFGDCPVASSRTVCCNLKTIDAVENCAFGCSYCTIQTFYGDRVVFDRDLKAKLARLELDPGRFYHIGTGQSSDSLAWGNRDGILDDLCDFARRHPNVLLEFKTKSDKISYFLTHEVPPNMVCSWSLNPEKVIQNEEHLTASLARRLEAARSVRDRGMKVAFHFHPIVYYEGWQADYTMLAAELQRQFRPAEVLFISFGSVTFIKPVIQEIRKRGEPTKILQMEMVPDPHGKLTYPDPVKLLLFRTMYRAFEPWHGAVFFYLCMERAYFWDEVFGWHYPTNEEFERDFGVKTMSKITSGAAR
ncbi:MAG: DNA photolyase [Candidatus Omnitrophica bacterium]|nr:DNA photolyase [Candidatus Omnitrophota bacterium]